MKYDADDVNLRCRLALTEEERRAVRGTLATDDLWLIWLRTGHGSTARDRRTHQNMETELQRRGLVEGEPLPPAAEAT
jgi:hypothetical protein